MFRLATQTKETASGSTAEIFSRFPPQVGVSKVMLLLSASPGLLKAYSELILGYYGAQEHLSLELLAAIRFVVSRELALPECLDFNQKLLLALGLAAQEVEALPDSRELFSEADRALMDYCVTLVREPGAVTDEGVAALRGHGWTDADIMDVSLHAVNLQGASTLLRALTR